MHIVREIRTTTARTLKSAIDVDRKSGHRVNRSAHMTSVYRDVERSWTDVGHNGANKARKEGQD